MRSRLLPVFTPKSLVRAENGKQDKIEYSVKLLAVIAANQEEVSGILSGLGPAPYVWVRENGRDRQTRVHENYGAMHGWIFRAVNTREWSLYRTQKIRRSPLSMLRHDDGDFSLVDLDSPLIVQPPLFTGGCDWAIREHGDYWAMSGTLNLSVNPTRFIRHRPEEEPLPQGMRRRHPDEPSPFEENGEHAFDEQDNWLPLDADLFSRLTPDCWLRHVRRYLRGIEEACEQEVARACIPLGVRPIRKRRKYNVTHVETYWEWVARDPITTVNDLIPFARTFTSRSRGERIYSPDADTERVGDLTILRIETAPGELLKIYAKTNRRIRMEVRHILAGENRFQFPRERNESRHTSRSSAHTFDSIAGMIGFFDRLQNRAASVVNGFLRHVADQAEVAPSAVSAFDALLGVLNAVSNDHSQALEVASLLIQGAGMTPGGSEAHQQTIAALRRAGIIKLNRTRTRYVLTADYRHPFQMLREHGSFPFLTQRGAGKIRRRKRTMDHHVLLD